ncbi:MAG TPA: hypothetical protein VE396_13475 [Xanthobacteraceae bacterium]|nr:hypothetical protein [Xanthobacteraceae bacterium]
MTRSAAKHRRRSWPNTAITIITTTITALVIITTIITTTAVTITITTITTRSKRGVFSDAPRGFFANC